MAENELKELGYTGLDSWSGRVREDFLTELNSLSKRYKAFNEMRRNSPIIGGLLYSITQGLRGVDWSFTSEEGEDDERVEFLTEAMNSMSYSWNDFMVEVLTMLPFGFAPFEIVYEKRDDGRIYWRKMAIRGQDTIERWDLQDDGGISGLYQRGAPSYQLIHIPIDKLVLFRTRVEKNNPEGQSILRNAYRSYYFTKHIETFEGIGIERDMAGMPVLRLPEGADRSDSTTSDFGIAKKTVRNIRKDEQDGLVLPHGWEFELASTGGSRLINTNEVIQRHESRMLISTLAQFLILGQDSVGTQALESGFGSRFNDSLDAIADMIAETFTKYGAWRLLELNGMDTEGVKLQHSPAGDIDVLAFSDAFSKIVPSLTLFPQDEIWIRSIFGMPEVDEETLQEEREAEQERKSAMMQNFNKPGDNDDDDMSAEIFAADAAPDDDKRKYYERRYARLWQDVLSNQFNDVKKGAKRLKRNAASIS